MESNVIPNELMHQWEKEAEWQMRNWNITPDTANELYIEGYINGRTDQYIQMQDEIERLKGLVDKAYITGLSYCKNPQELTLDDFKTEHKL